MLHSVCQQVWKIQQCPQDWKRSVFFPIPKKGNGKECSNYHTSAPISHASEVMLKILQARLQQYVNQELPDVQAGFRKGRGTRDQIANIRWIIEKNYRTLEIHLILLHGGFSDISVNKESTYNTGYPGSIPGSRRSTREGISYPLQYSWASLVTQPVKNLPAMLETWVQSLSWEDPLEKGKTTYSSILAWRIPWTAFSMGSRS